MFHSDDILNVTGYSLAIVPRVIVPWQAVTREIIPHETVSQESIL